MSDTTRSGSAGGGRNASIVRSSIPSAVDAMVSNIRRLIADGGLVVGDSLPTQRELQTWIEAVERLATQPPEEGTTR